MAKLAGCNLFSDARELAIKLCQIIRLGFIIFAVSKQKLFLNGTW